MEVVTLRKIQRLPLKGKQTTLVAEFSRYVATGTPRHCPTHDDTRQGLERRLMAGRFGDETLLKARPRGETPKKTEL